MVSLFGRTVFAKKKLPLTHPHPYSMLASTLASTWPRRGLDLPRRLETGAQSTAPLNFRAISSASPPSCWTQKQRRHGGQRDEDPSSQRPGIRPSNGISCPIRLRRLVWILDREERQGECCRGMSGLSIDTCQDCRVLEPCRAQLSSWRTEPGLK